MLLSEVTGEEGSALGRFLLFFNRARALETFTTVLLPAALEFPMTGRCEQSDTIWSISSRIVDESGEFYLLQGKLAATVPVKSSIEAIECAGEDLGRIVPTVLTKGCRDTGPEDGIDSAQNECELSFCLLWRAPPSRADRTWILLVTIINGTERTELPIPFACRRSSDRDVSRDIVKVLLEEWRIDEPTGWKLAEFVSGSRISRFRSRIVRTEAYRFGPDLPAKRSIVVYLSRMTVLFSVNMFMSEFVALEAQGTELIILVVGKQAWSDLFEQCLARIEGICQSPIRVIYSQGSIPAAMALAAIVRMLRSDAVLLMPAEFSWPAFQPLFEAVEGSDGVLLLDPVPDWRPQDAPLSQRSALESFVFAQRNLLGRQHRRPVLAERGKLISILSGLPVFLRDEMLYEELGRYLEDRGTPSLQAVGCFPVEVPAKLTRMERVVNQLIALHHLRPVRDDGESR